MMGKKGQLPSDRELGIKASRKEFLQKERFEHPHKSRGQDYQPTSSEQFERMLLEVRAELSDYVLVDIGAGKGRVLCLAANYPFAEIQGVELANRYHQTALENILSMKKSFRRCSKVSCLNIDALEYIFPSQPLVIYLFNPFDRYMMEKLCQNIGDSYQAQPRPIYVLYLEPMHSEPLLNCAGLKQIYQEREFMVFANAETGI